MSKKYSSLLILIAFLFTGCDFSDSKLVVANNSNDSIAFIIPAEPNYFPTDDYSKKPIISKHLNDSLLNTKAKYDWKEGGFGGVHFLAGDSSRHILAFNTKWESIINSTPEKKLKVLFIPASFMTSGQYTWKEIYDKEMFTKKKEFTIDELDKLDWKVTYK